MGVSQFRRDATVKHSCIRTGHAELLASLSIPHRHAARASGTRPLNSAQESVTQNWTLCTSPETHRHCCW